MVCKETMERVTPGHLREHGISIARYERMYGPRRLPSRAERLPSGSVSDPNSALVDAVGERLQESQVWVACVANEVGERMMNGPLRQRLTAMLTTMLFQRYKVHGESLAILSSALEELRAEWRIAQGGENGGPTDTLTLLQVIDRAEKLVGNAEEAVQRTIKLALEEQKASHQYADGVGPTLYTGTGEVLDMPAGLPSGDRETMRNLLAMIGKAANERGTITVEATPSPLPPGAPTTPPHPLTGNRAPVQSDNDGGVHPLAQGNDPPTPSPGGPPPPPTPAPQGGARNGRKKRGSLTDPTTSGALTDPTSPSTPSPTGRRTRAALDERPVNDPARPARDEGGPARGGGSVAQLSDDAKGVIVKAVDQVKAIAKQTADEVMDIVKATRTRASGPHGTGSVDGNAESQRRNRAKEKASWQAFAKTKEVNAKRKKALAAAATRKRKAGGKGKAKGQ